MEFFGQKSVWKYVVSSTIQSTALSIVLLTTDEKILRQTKRFNKNNIDNCWPIVSRLCQYNRNSYVNNI